MWVKVHKIVEGHASNNYHFRAVRDALDFQRSIEQPEMNIDMRISADLFQRIQENRHNYSQVLCRMYTLLWPTMYSPSKR